MSPPLEKDDEEKQEQGGSILGWTAGLLWKLVPFKKESPISEAERTGDLSSSNQTQPVAIPNATQHVDVREIPNDSLNELEESTTGSERSDSSDGSPARPVDIHQLIAEAQTDSDDDLARELGIVVQFSGVDEAEDLDIIPEGIGKDPLPEAILGYKGRVKSSELLRLPFRYQPSRPKSSARRRTIKFDNIAVLLDAAAEGDLDEVRRLVSEERVEIDMCNERGVTALHRAAGHGQTAVLEFLLKKKARVNVVDADSWTPLHIASSVGSLEAVKCLLKHGANVEARTDAGEAPSDLTEIPEILRHIQRIQDLKYISAEVVALYDFIPDTNENDELPFSEGDRLQVKSREDEDWWLAELDGHQGYIPRNWVQ